MLDDAAQIRENRISIEIIDTFASSGKPVGSLEATGLPV
jgi:hypothetical protein